MKTYGKLIVVISILIIMLASMGAINAKENLFSESTRSHEIIELRNNNSKTYQLSDGSKEWIGYAEDIHYLDENEEDKVSAQYKGAW